MYSAPKNVFDTRNILLSEKTYFENMKYEITGAYPTIVRFEIEVIFFYFKNTLPYCKAGVVILYSEVAELDPN
jgi:hypothetical protein